MEYAKLQNQLPQVIYANNPAYEKIFDLTWQIAVKNYDDPNQPGWLPQMTCMPGVGVLWQWDSCFMSFISRYANGTMSALNNLDNLYRLQRSDGYISMAYVIKDEKAAYGERVNPPLFAWAELENFRYSNDYSRLERVWPILKKYFYWLKNNRRRSNGLYWFEDTGSSGMDNSPRSAYLSVGLQGSEICFVDISCQQLLSAKCLQQIAGYLGDDVAQEEFALEYETLRKIINHYCYCERHGFYYDCFERELPSLRHNFLGNRTAAAFWAIISQAADDGKIKRLVEDYLLNPDEFGTPHPVASLSRQDPNYTKLGGYWLGSVWAPINYMVCRGLSENHYYDLAREISFKHLNMMCQVAFDSVYGGIWECYSPELPRPACGGENGDLVRDDFVGWSGLGSVCLLIENIIGLDFDAGNNTINWNIQDTKEHGLKNIQFNAQTLNLVCHGRQVWGETLVIVDCEKEIKINFKVKGHWGNIEKVLPAGHHEFKI